MLIEAIRKRLDDYDQIKKYYTENISYKLTPEKKKGLELFLELIKNK